MRSQASDGENVLDQFKINVNLSPYREVSKTIKMGIELDRSIAFLKVGWINNHKD